MYINQPLPVIILFVLCGITIIGMLIYEIHTDIKQYKLKKFVERNTKNKCPTCNKILKLQNVDKQGEGDIDYFTYCDKCKTMYKIKYKEKLNDYESNNKRKVK